MEQENFERLETALFEAGRVFPYPATPHLSVQVREALERERMRRPWWSVNWNLPRLALTLAAAIVIALAALLAYPESREAIAQLLGLRTVRIIYVTPTPVVITQTPGATPTARPFSLCCETTLEDAQRRARFKLLVPPGESPSKVYFQQLFDEGQQVVLVFGDPQNPRFTLYQAQRWIYEKMVNSGAIGKVVGPGTKLEETQVRGDRAIWFSGAPHVVLRLDQKGTPIPDTERSVNANTLVWETGPDMERGITYRLETNMDLAQAVRFANSLIEIGAPTETPTVSRPTPLAQCCETTLDDARRRAKFKILLPPGELPSKVHLQENLVNPDSQQSILVFGDPQNPKFVLYQAQNYLYGKVIGTYLKEIDGGTKIDETEVKGHRAIWFSGAAHLVVYLDQYGNRQFGTERIVNANTLVWETGPTGSDEHGITYRLETRLSEAEAVRIAESLQ